MLEGHSDTVKAPARGIVPPRSRIASSICSLSRSRTRPGGDSWNFSRALKKRSSTSSLTVGMRKMWVWGMRRPRAYMHTNSGDRVAIMRRATVRATRKRLSTSSSSRSCHQGTCLLEMTRQWPLV